MFCDHAFDQRNGVGRQRFLISQDLLAIRTVLEQRERELHRILNRARALLHGSVTPLAGLVDRVPPTVAGRRRFPAGPLLGQPFSPIAHDEI